MTPGQHAATLDTAVLADKTTPVSEYRCFDVQVPMTCDLHLTQNAQLTVPTRQESPLVACLPDRFAIVQDADANHR